jgi:pimeloyl-ACP methyl ester carboxylesterase
MKEQKQIIVFIHGMWGTKEFWNNYIQYYEALGYTCIALNLPYHDQATNSQVGNISIQTYINYVQKEIQKIGKPVIIIGHSMGGLIAQKIAELEQKLVESAVLITPASPRGIFAITPSVLRSFSSVLFRWGFWNKSHKLTLKKAVYAMLHIMPEKEHKRIYKSFVKESGRAAFEIGFWLFDRKKTTQVNAKKVSQPMLVIAGREDRITPASVVKKIAKRYKNATYKSYPNHAHWITQEPGWKVIASDIDDYLKTT